MDFVDEEDVALTKVRQSADEIAGFFEGGAGGGADVDAELSGDQLSEGCLAETWWAEEESVVERFSPGEGGIDVDAQGFLHPILADEFGEALGAERELDYALLGDDFRSGYFGSGH